MDELAKIQNSLEDMKATQDVNSDLYDDVHHYPTTTITKIPSNLKSTDEEDDHNLKDSGIKIIKKGKLHNTQQNNNSSLENVIGDQDNLKMIQAGDNVEGFLNYSNNNYYLFILLLLLLLILLLK